MSGPKLESETIVVSAPMSFHGSAARIWKMTEGKKGGEKLAWGALAAVLVAGAWLLVLGWYVIFGLLVIPYRLIRRGQRKRKLAEARHREMLATSTAAVAATTPALAQPAPQPIEAQRAQPQLDPASPSEGNR